MLRLKSALLLEVMEKSMSPEQMSHESITPELDELLVASCTLYEQLGTLKRRMDEQDQVLVRAAAAL